MPTDTCTDHAPTARERPMLDLLPEELLVVGAFRAWFARRLRPDRPAPDWRALFGVAGIAPSGAVGFDLLLSVIGEDARRLIELRCCSCPALGRDEAALLRLVASLQAGATLAALEVLSDWLPPGVIAPALRGANRFAVAMAAAGFRLDEVAPPPPVSAVPPPHLLH
jgi:hypothetical protein